MSVTGIDQGVVAVATNTFSSSDAVITDISKMTLVNMASQPLSPDKIGKPGIHSSHRPGSAANPDYENNLARFNQLADIILDETNAYSKDAKLDAWNAQFKMAVDGQLMGMPPEVNKRFEAIGRSSTFQDIENARMALMSVQWAAVDYADANGIDRSKALAQATLDHIKNMSGLDVKLLFTSVSPPDMFGNQRFKDVADWKQKLFVEAGLLAPLDETVRLDLSEKATGLLGELKSNLVVGKFYEPGDNTEAWA